ncbi:MAG: DNA polymerase I [Clostridia bacterium]|nr:DNA polymerase I [Clostridia bacterium]
MNVLIIDGNSLLNRAFYGIKVLTTRDGRCTNAVYGFLNTLASLREATQPEVIVAAFDVHAPTFRHKLYDEYKAGRHKTPEELLEQFPPVKNILKLMGCHVLECEGYEADDLLGTLSLAAEQAGHTVYLATGDRDSFQLVSDRTTVLLAATRMGRTETEHVTPAVIKEKYGLTPAGMIDLKALMGDSSDHIPGVPGIGEKTALSLLHQFGDLDSVLANADNPALSAGVRKKLTEGAESARLSRTLGTICRTAPIDADAAHYRLQPVDREALALALADLEFFKMIDKMGLETPVTAAPENEQLSLSFTASESAEAGDEAWESVAAAVRRNGTADVYAEWNGNVPEALWFCLPDTVARITRVNDAATLLTDGVKLRTHESKPLYAWLLSLGKQPTVAAFDTALAAYLLNPLASGYPLDRLLAEHGLACNTPAACANSFPALCDKLAAELSETNMSALLAEMELPLALVLAKMEAIGFVVDGDGIARFGEQLSAEVEALSAEIYGLVGYEFNLNSPKQLGKAFFEDLQLPGGKKTKTGWSTNADVLEKLRPSFPVVDKLLQYRSLAKLKSTYCDGLIKQIEGDGRIHSCFNQTETRTGRISSSEPNLQNIPVRSERGREMRRFFCAQDGWTLVDADYSQIELRVLAHMADDPRMIAAFNSETDIHRVTASQVFGVPENEVTPALRSRAKAVNFGIVYGIGAHSLSEDLGVPYGEAKRYIDSYLATYSGISAFMDDRIEAAKKCGFAVTMAGRRRPLPELRASNAMMRSFGERVARNMPIQGTAADIIKNAMIRVDKRLADEGLRARLILQVHDELIVESPADEAERVRALLEEEMRAAADMKVALSVDAHIGDTWYEAKG